MRTLWMFLFATMLAASAVSCGGSPQADLCNHQCDCEGCSDGAYNKCFDSYDADVRSAGYQGCVDLYDALLDCQQATGTCVGTDWKTSCGDEKDRLDHCIKK